jgi:hypothetical protein
MCSGEGDWTCLQPGFPIRKSSDHSLVIDSPRLIADSYVLLRFLVPRHPPCALKNLATNKRCSRPLCSSQHTGGPPSSGVAPTPHSGWLSSGMQRGSSTRRGPDRRTPIQKESSSSPEPSGPNNVPGAATRHRFPLPCVYLKTWPVKAGVVLAA